MWFFQTTDTDNDDIKYKQETAVSNQCENTAIYHRVPTMRQYVDVVISTSLV